MASFEYQSILKKTIGCYRTAAKLFKEGEFVPKEVVEKIKGESCFNPNKDPRKHIILFVFSI